MANFFDRFDAPTPTVVPKKKDQQHNFFDQFDEAQPPTQPLAQPPTQPLAAEEPVSTGKPASVIPQLPVAPIESTVPEDEGFWAANYRYAKDALISGFENLRANTKGEAFAIARGYIQSFEREYGGPGVPLAPPDVKKEYEKYRSEAGQYAQDIANFQKEAQERQLASPLRPETARLKAAMGDDLTFLESAKEAGAALFSNPVGVIADLGAESLPNMAYMVATALIGRLAAQNPTIAAQAGGLGSAATQFGNEYVDRLQKGESHDEAWKNASIRSGVIGVFDAVSLKTAGSAAGKIVEALKTGKPASVAAKEFVKETGKQAGLGGAGEAAGSLAIGEVPNPAAVIAEMAGETVTAPFEAIGTYQRVKGIEKLSKEDQAIADLDRLAAEEEAEAAEAGVGPLVSEADLFPEEAGIPLEETVPATLDELKKIDKDLRKKLGRPPTTDEVERALNDFEREKTRRLRVESGRGEPSVPVSGAEEARAGVAGAPERIEPRGLGAGVGPVVSTGARKEPTLGPLEPTSFAAESGDYIVDDVINEDQPQQVQLSVRPDGTGSVIYKDRVMDVSEMIQSGYTAEQIIAQKLGVDTSGRNVKKLGALTPPSTPTTKPEDTYIFSEMFRFGSESPPLQNYFKTYFGLPAKSLPAAASKLMPLLQRAEELYNRSKQAYDQSNQPRGVTSPEYSEVFKNLPSGDVRRLANTALAIDNKYKTKSNNPERFAKEVADFEAKLNDLEAAIGNLPPPLSDEERQARQAEYDAKNPPVDVLGEIMGGIRRGITAPSDSKPGPLGYGRDKFEYSGLDQLVSSGVTTYEELDNLENAFVDKYKKLAAEGKVSQKALDFVQERSRKYFEERAQQAAPTEPIGPTMAGMQAELDALKAAGAEVPTFSPPSTGADKRAAKAKRERSKAIAKLAAELGGTPADEEGGFRPARDEEDGGETIKAKPGVNARRLSKLLGPKLYGEPSQMPNVSVKEMVQNAFDAIKPMQEKGQLVKGKIDITVDKDTRSITVVDNGTGMSPETLSTTFLTIAGTKKEGERDSGGLGIAKMQFLFNNDEIQVVTMRDGVASVLRSDGATLEASMDDPSVSPDVTVYKGDNIPDYIKQILPEGHGTYVSVVVPKSYKDTSTGQDVEIDISDYSGAYKVLNYSPLFGDIEVKFNDRTLGIGSKFPYEDYTTFANVTFDWGVARIYVQKEPQKYMWDDNTSVLSNGLWQFNLNLEVNDEKIPRRIYVDVSPKKEVKPEDARYPFDLNRQRFSPAVEKSFSQIFKYLRLAYRAADFASSVDNFGSIQYLDLVGRNDDVQASPLEKLAPTPTSEIFTATDISEGDQIQVKDGVLYVKGKAVRELTDADMKSATIDVDELRIDESLISKDRVMLHINTGVAKVDDKKVKELRNKVTALEDEIYKKYGTFSAEDIEDQAGRAEYKGKISKLRAEIKKAEQGDVTSIADIGRQKFGAKFDEFLFDIGKAFLDLRNFAATLEPRFSIFTDEAVGVSLDSGYRGVSIKIPFAGVFINPFAPAVANLSAAASGTWGTMVHELAHVTVRSHGADFTAEMQRINLLLDASEIDGNNTWPQIKNSIRRAYRDYKDVFEYFNKELTDGNLKPLGKRLSDSSEEQIGDGGDSERVAGFRGATESESDLSRRIGLGAENIGEERERARDAGEATTTDYEQRIIELGLKAGDINPAMVKAIANNDLNGALTIASQKLTGFSADLAKALLELKLPTNISFNTGTELVRRSIDDATQPQQERLFRYVQMHYPQVYDKYFKNYDRSESLESVAAGLIELQKPNYNLGPVIAEFGDVSGAYKKFIEGLTAPGAYYPAFDEIALNTDTLTGKSYRVFLHEVVHAATEYVLNTFGTRPQDLTPGQRAAAKELTAMYDYAVEKLGKTPYGMTNIYEFVAEVFTNKKFQDLLKGVKYEPKKAPFFTRLVRAIFKAFGLDNLAGNAMAEATKIFSAVRTTTPLSIGPRFAKTGPKQPRIRGPVSQTWRTAEDVNAGMIQMFNDALRGRREWSKVLKVIGPSMWDSSTGTFRRAVLGFANLRQIDDLTKTKFPQISGAIRMIEQMLAYRGNIMKSAEDIVTKWTKAQAKKPKQGQLLGRVMLETTIRGIDPDKPGTKTMNAALVQAWNRLDPEFKEIYREVRDFYERSVNNMVREMKLRVAKSDKPLAEKKAAIREINDKFGPDKLVKPYFPLRRFGKHWFQVGKGNFKEFYEFEGSLSRELAMRTREAQLRRGNAQQQALADTIRKGDGISELFTQNLTTTQVLKEAEDIIDNVTATTVGDAKKEMKDSLNQLIYILLPQQSMRKMFINRKAIQGASGDMLRVFATSAVHSAYQQSRFKFAEPFLNNLNNARQYIADRVEEGSMSRDRAAVYSDYITEVERRVPTILSNEDTSLAAVVAGKASELTFFYMLSAPFSAMLNVLGVAQITMPYIGGRYGYAKTNAVMLKNLGRYFATTPRRTLAPLAQGKFMEVNFPSIVEGAKLPPILNRAAQRFMEEGQINISLTNDLMDMGGRPSSLYTGRYNMVKKMLSGLFHQSERLGREVSLLSAFELAYDKFSKAPKKDLRGVIERDAQGQPVMNTPEEAFELAIAEAKDIVGLSLGDFTRQMKPRYFVSPLMSVVTKFKQYSVLATYAIVRNFYFTVAAPFRKGEIEEFRQQMVKDKVSSQVIDQRIAEAEAQRKELYREGKRRLAGILAVTYILGGNEASPFYSIGLQPLVKLLADEDDDEFFDWENWLKNYMEEELGGAAGDLFAEMGMDPEKAEKAGRFVGGSLQRGVVTELTGGELSSRVSLDPKNLWYREGRYSPDTRESVTQEIIANAGPVVGLGFNWIDAYRLFQEGQYQRAFERAAPALISKPVTAARIAEEDARTASGIKLVDNFSAWELAMQSIGLQPTRLAQAQKSAIEAKTYAEKIKDRRTSLLNRLWLERDNTEGFNETLEKVIEFSLKYPEHEITPENIQESFDRRAEGQAEAEAIGVQVDKKSLPKALEMLRYGRPD